MPKTCRVCEDCCEHDSHGPSMVFSARPSVARSYCSFLLPWQFRRLQQDVLVSSSSHHLLHALLTLTHQDNQQLLDKSRTRIACQLWIYPPSGCCCFWYVLLTSRTTHEKSTMNRIAEVLCLSLLASPGSHHSIPGFIALFRVAR